MLFFNTDKGGDDHKEDVGVREDEKVEHSKEAASENKNLDKVTDFVEEKELDIAKMAAVSDSFMWMVFSRCISTRIDLTPPLGRCCPRNVGRCDNRRASTARS
jgi:hypothetical protein